ncbi:hypothetical protein [Flaviaesturariibacter terrae]
MIKEYEKLYGKLDAHQQVIEKTIQFYLVFIGALISFISFSKRDVENLHLFKLDILKIFSFSLVSLVGLFIFFKIVEHRILVIAYVKSINLNRKWFLQNSEDKRIEEFLFWRADVNQPPYYRKYRHFYWEALIIAFINSIFISIAVINIATVIFSIKSIYAEYFNWSWFGVLSGMTTYFLMKYYKVKALVEENKIHKRFNKAAQ